MNYDYHGLPEDLPFQQKEAIEQVDKQDVVEAAKANLKPDSLRVVILADKTTIDTQPEEMGLGPVVEVDITIPSGEEKKELAISADNLARGREIIQAAAAAAGGVEGFERVEAVSLKGTVTLSTPQGEFPVQVESIEVYPDKSRTVINMMGQQIVTVRAGDQGWNKAPGAGVSPMPPEELEYADKEIKRELTLLFQRADDPELNVLYDGSGEVNGEAVDYVVLLDENDESICRMAFAADDHQILSRTYWGQSPMGEGNIEEYFSDFREVTGLSIPHSIERHLNGNKFAVTRIDALKVNPEIPADAFDKPAE
jgi:hypothetical protein